MSGPVRRGFLTSEASTDVECSIELRCRSRQRRIEWTRGEITIQEHTNTRSYSSILRNEMTWLSDTAQE